MPQRLNDQYICFKISTVRSLFLQGSQFTCSSKAGIHRGPINMKSIKCILKISKGCIRSDLQMRDLPASVELRVQKLAAGKQSAAVVVVAAAAVVGDHCSPFGLLYALEDANTCTFLYDTVPKNSNEIVCESFINCLVIKIYNTSYLFKQKELSY